MENVKRREKDGTLEQAFLHSSRGADGAVHSHSGCAVYVPRGLPLCEETGDTHLPHLNELSGSPNYS